MQSFFMFTVLAALTGQAFALNVQLGKTLGNVTAENLLNFGSANTMVSQLNCAPQCNSAMDILQKCGQDDRCTCRNETGVAMLSCEQCLFTAIVDRNIPSPNPLMGLQPALDAFVAACHAPPLNTTVMPLKLTIPPSMHGPQSITLGTGAAAVAVTAGGLLGAGFLYMFSTLE